GPARVGPGIDALGGLERWQPVGEGVRRLAMNVLEVLAHLDRPLDVAQRAVPGYDHVRRERYDRVERLHPLRARSFPPDRRAQPEEPVAGEDDVLARQVNDEVTRGVRGPDPEEVHRDAVELELEPLVDQGRRRGQLDALEVPVGELRGEIGDRRLAALR